MKIYGLAFLQFATEVCEIWNLNWSWLFKLELPRIPRIHTFCSHAGIGPLRLSIVFVIISFATFQIQILSTSYALRFLLPSSFLDSMSM